MPDSGHVIRLLFRLAGFGMASVLFSFPAYAEDLGSKNFYVTVAGAFAHLDDSHIDYAHGALPDRTVGFDPGWAVSTALGWRPTDCFRVELEAGRRSNGVLIVTPGNLPGGAEDATTFMVNGYFDIPTKFGVTPYVGAGLGGAILHQRVAADGGTLTDSDSHGLGYQFVAGIAVPIASGGWTATVDYRYLATTSPVFIARNGTFYDASYSSHSLFVGLRYQF